MFEKKSEIPLDQFIYKALYHPKKGYYMKNMPFGKDGDFITAPNISKIFSEISRVLKKDGIFILTDSLQLGDNYILDPLLEFFPYSTHEPYYSKYIREDLVSNAEKFGLKMYYSKKAYLSKTLAFKKI